MFLLLVLCLLLPCEVANSTNKPPQKDGKIALIITLGDIDNTPADHAIIHVYGQGSDRIWGREMPILQIKPGQYEATLPAPGIYDVLVSESGSLPRCRRMMVRPGLTSYWTLKLEIDDVYLHGDVF
jgi:hypothetical protein